MLFVNKKLQQVDRIVVDHQIYIKLFYWYKRPA